MAGLDQECTVTLSADEWAWVVGTLRAAAENMSEWLDRSPEQAAPGADADALRLAVTAQMIGAQVGAQLEGE